MAKSASYVSDTCVGITKRLKALSDRHSLWSVFEDWLEICAISISNSVDWVNREKREAKYLEKINKYTPDEQKILIETFAELVKALETEQRKNGPTDILTILTCNRCGAEIPDYNKKDHSAKILLNAPGEYRGCGGQRIDLCIKCYSKFIEFLESGDDTQ